MSVLNRSSKISCSIKGKTAFGTLVWNGYDPTIMHLESVPKFENVQVGDTIQTSGYSTMFPKGILVGKVQKVNVPPGSNNYEIAVHLFNNPIITQYAYVINNRFAVEQLTLESEVDQ